MVEPLDPSELSEAIALFERAGLAGAATSVARYLRWQPDGAWRVRIGGALAGTVTLLRHGHIGFVGCMAVDEAHRSRGLGRRLLEHAHAAGRRAGITTFLLEATAAGRPLYDKLGYVDEYETWNVARPVTAPVTASEPLRDLGAERAAILALDQRATGSRRDAMIGGLIAEHRGAVVHGDTLAGYGIVVDGRLGPVVARDPVAGRALIDRLAPFASFATVPVPNEAAMAAFAANGFTPLRSLRRMRLGPAIPTPGWLWSLASPGAG
ncbi:MAG: GNAT family N-acetyltransferase [Kofleriaceae bacterium]